MYSTDFSKMFDPSQYTQYAQTMQSSMQKMFDWTGAMSTSKSSLECMKQVNSLVTDTIATCTEQQFKFAQSTMEDCIETMRELSSAKGMDDYMAKQTEMQKRNAEKAQQMAQQIATQWQKTQTKCTDIISQQMSQTMEWASKSSTATMSAASKSSSTSSSSSK